MHRDNIETSVLITRLDSVTDVNSDIVAMIFWSRCGFIDDNVREEGFLSDNFLWEINSR